MTHDWGRGERRVLRVYHAGRNPAHRLRERALDAAGIRVTLVVPDKWPGEDGEELPAEPFSVVELSIKNHGDINRHAYRDLSALRQVIHDVKPAILDIHEEPFSVASRQWL